MSDRIGIGTRISSESHPCRAVSSLFLSEATATFEGDSSVRPVPIKGGNMTSVAVPTLTTTPMTVLNYALPPPIYLPSSGGYTSSRFVEDVSFSCVLQTFYSLLNPSTKPLHQRVFPFRRYSVDEDGRLVYRTRSANREPSVLFLRLCHPLIVSSGL